MNLPNMLDAKVRTKKDVRILYDDYNVDNNLIEDDDEYYATCCEVGTKEVRQLLEEWCDAVREFKKNTSENMSSDGK